MTFSKSSFESLLAKLFILIKKIFASFIENLFHKEKGNKKFFFLFLEISLKEDGPSLSIIFLNTNPLPKFFSSSALFQE